MAPPSKYTSCELIVLEPSLSSMHYTWSEHISAAPVIPVQSVSLKMLYSDDDDEAPLVALQSEYPPGPSRISLGPVPDTTSTSKSSKARGKASGSGSGSLAMALNQASASAMAVGGSYTPFVQGPSVGSGVAGTNSGIARGGGEKGRRIVAGMNARDTGRVVTSASRGNGSRAEDRAWNDDDDDNDEELDDFEILPGPGPSATSFNNKDNLLNPTITTTTNNNNNKRKRPSFSPPTISKDEANKRNRRAVRASLGLEMDIDQKPAQGAGAGNGAGNGTDLNDEEEDFEEFPVYGEAKSGGLGAEASSRYWEKKPRTIRGGSEEEASHGSGLGTDQTEYTGRKQELGRELTKLDAEVNQLGMALLTSRQASSFCLSRTEHPMR